MMAMNRANADNVKDAPRIRRVDGPTSLETPLHYTIATLVNDMNQYEAMKTSFISAGFLVDDCEYVLVDNTSSPQTDAYRGLNALLSTARGEFVILCHQDVRLLTDARADLDKRLTNLSEIDSRWALAGNAGGIRPGELAIRITDPHGANQKAGNLPARVQTLDENFIIVRREARIGFSNDLTGFHYYGADICLHADIAGYTAYVIDFHLAHLSAGRKDGTFRDMEEKFRSAWQMKLRPRWLQTTCNLVHLSGGAISQITGRLAETSLSRIKRRLPGSNA
jgi:hypothetical protein